MLRANIPVTANLVLTELLDFARFNIGLFLPDMLPAFIADRGWMEMRNALYVHELFVACGYKENLTINLAMVLALMSAGLAIWLAFSVKDLLCTCVSRKNKRYEMHGNNLMVRILYECCFEIVLCLLIS